jgi:hypothetical protein
VASGLFAGGGTAAAERRDFPAGVDSHRFAERGMRGERDERE